MPAILLTRPKEGATRFAQALRADLGDVHIVSSPVLRIVATAAQPDLSDDPILIFTSRNGVEHCGLKVKQGLFCLCVGEATARAARQAGFTARAAGGDVAALLKRIEAERPRRPLLHLRGAHSTGDLVQNLRRLGLTARDCVVYDQQMQPLSQEARKLLSGEAAVIVPLFSPRSARALAAQHVGRAPLDIVAISDAVARSAAGMPYRHITVAPAPDMAAMVTATCERFGAAQLLEGG